MYYKFMCGVGGGENSARRDKDKREISNHDEGLHQTQQRRAVRNVCNEESGPLSFHRRHERLLAQRSLQNVTENWRQDAPLDTSCGAITRAGSDRSRDAALVVRARAMRSCMPPRRRLSINRWGKQTRSHRSLVVLLGVNHLQQRVEDRVAPSLARTFSFSASGLRLVSCASAVESTYMASKASTTPSTLRKESGSFRTSTPRHTGVRMYRDDTGPNSETSCKDPGHR